MIKQLLQDIAERKDTRQNLIALRAQLKENKAAQNLCLEYLSSEPALFTELLQDEDAKVRKNSALILGDLCSHEAEQDLFTAYEKEETRFVRPAYLTALLRLRSTAFHSQLKSILQELESAEIPEESRKHRAEERNCIRELLALSEERQAHTFIAYDSPAELVLLTNRNHIHVTAEQLKAVRFQTFNAGIRLQTKHLSAILPIRTYEEMLFVVPGMSACPAQPIEAAQVIAKSGLLRFLEQSHKEPAPFRFRIEQRGVLDLEKRSRFVKQMADELERLTNYQLINSPGDYEVEIRMIGSRDEKYNLLVKLYTLPDERFCYRKESSALDLKPVNAALTMALVKEYLKEGAQILDPFCGVGTMLVERAKLLEPGTMYGLDIYREQVEKARKNTEAADLRVNFINRDFFDFKHEYLFDEVITNMPSVLGKKEESEILSIYRRFFTKVREHLNQDGIIVLYTHNRELVRKFAGIKPFRIECEYEISMREKSYVFVIRFCMPA